MKNTTLQSKINKLETNEYWWLVEMAGVLPFNMDVKLKNKIYEVLLNALESKKQ